LRLLHHAPRPAEQDRRLSIASESGKAIDYYFVAGEGMDEIVAGYRALTGKAVMLPKWAFGFWQSRERYMTQEQLLDVLEEYPNAGFPWTTSCSTGSTGRRTPGAATSSTRHVFRTHARW
jgi:alpha-D-xyloside xylohydrolase